MDTGGNAIIISEPLVNGITFSSHFWEINLRGDLRVNTRSKRIQFAEPDKGHESVRILLHPRKFPSRYVLVDLVYPPCALRWDRQSYSNVIIYNLLVEMKSGPADHFVHAGRPISSFHDKLTYVGSELKPLGQSQTIESTPTPYLVPIMYQEWKYF